MAQLVGLDIGASAVRAAEVDSGDGSPTLSAFGQVGLPPGTIVDGEIRDVTAVVDALKRLWQNGKFSTKSVVVGIAGLRAITREIDLPWVPDDEIDSAVSFQSEEVIPFTPEKTLLSAQALSEGTQADGSRTRQVLVAAAHRDLVDPVVEAVEKAGLDIKSVDLISSALVRGLVGAGQLSDKPEAIVSVGAGLTVIVVHHAGRPIFVRTLGVGGNAATDAIHQTLDLPQSDAELVKRRLDDSTPQLEAARRATLPVMEDLVSEIRNSIQYFSALPGHEPVGRVLVTGGGAQLRGLVEKLQEQVHVPVQVSSPLDRLNVSGMDIDAAQMAAIQPVLAASVGLVLPEPNSSVRKFNLVPPEVLRRSFEKKVTRYAYIGAGALIGLLVLFGLWQVLSVHSAENKVNSLQANVAQLNAEIPTYNSVVRVVSQLRTSKGQVSRLTSAAVDWAAVVSELDRVTPSGLGVTTFNGTSGTAGTGASSAGSGSSAGTAPPPAGAIGSITMSVGGSFPSSAHFSPVAEWIDAISSSKLFSPPSVSSVANSPSGSTISVTFQSVLSVLAPGSLAQNGHM